MSFYRIHIFFCTNLRDNGKKSCGQAHADEMRQYVKDKLKTLNLHKPGEVRVSSAGCMGRCQQGPALVIYPQGVWYTYHNQTDLDEIIERHILGGEMVERLLILM